MGRQLLTRLAEKFRMEVVNLSEVTVSRETLELVPREIAVRHRLLPLARIAGTLRVALADPLESEGT
ncbi:MAG: hypothetical protein Q8S47_15780, partial [Phenylobacterium sp.]|nr:hypothetical protein [Phenylobacterium sp.]